MEYYEMTCFDTWFAEIDWARAREQSGARMRQPGEFDEIKNKKEFTKQLTHQTHSSLFPLPSFFEKKSNKQSWLLHQTVVITRRNHLLSIVPIH